MFKRIVLTVAVAIWLAMPLASSRAADAPRAPVAEANAEAHGEHGPPPQLLPDPRDRNVQLQALWTLIIFIVLLMVLYPTAWRNVLTGLKKREERIRGDIADAEAARKR